MNDRIADLNEPAHRTTQELLPWHAMNKLSGKDLALVSAHVQACEQCRSDLEWERTLLGIEPEAHGAFDMERALDKLRPELETPRRLPLHQRLSRFVHGTGRPRASWMPWALAAQSAAIVALGVLLALPGKETAPYRTLGASKNAAGNAVVVFEPGTTEHDLRQMLAANGARIVDGPTVTDAYLLSLPSDRLESSLRMLRAEKGVKLAEPLVSGEEH